VNVRRVRAMTVASVKMIVRDRTALFFSLAFPIVFMTLFGLIFGNAGSSRPDLDVVGNGPIVQALQQSKAVKLHVRPDVKTALKRASGLISTTRRRRPFRGRSCSRSCRASRMR
jgi:Na+/citrate or Na+/malate symporter